MRKLFYFLAMSAVVLGMAFTFNACGGNDANNPEPRRFKMTVTKISDTSVDVEIQSPNQNVLFMDGYVDSETFFQSPRALVRTMLKAYKKENNPTYPEGLYTKDILKLRDLDSETEYAIYVCEVNEEYEMVGDVEYIRVRCGEAQEEPEDDGSNLYFNFGKPVLEFPLRGGYAFVNVSLKNYEETILEWEVDKPWVKLKKWGSSADCFEIIVDAGDVDEATVLVKGIKEIGKIVVKRNDSCDPGYAYRNSSTALEGTLSGKFSTGPYNAVYFSKGNLQYHVDDQIWRFAEKQTDVVNKGAYTYADEYELEKEWNHGWMDLFFWLCGKYPAEEPFAYYRFNQLHDQDIVPISNGGNKEGIWHSLTVKEWEYLFFGRDRASELFGQGTINGQKGVFILPDNWVQPAGIPSFTPPDPASWLLEGNSYRAPDDNVKHYADNTFTANEWKTMEEKGAVFLPAVYYVNEYREMEAKYQTYYSYSPIYQGMDVYFFLFNNWDFSPCVWNHYSAYNDEDNWVSVRLVRIAQK